MTATTKSKKKPAMPKKPYKVTIRWGSDNYADADPEHKPDTYTFATQAELDAFMLGATDAEGWDGFTVYEAGEEIRY